MNSKQILQALDATDENLLQEVDRIRCTKHKKSSIGYKWLAVAACLCVSCISVWVLVNSNQRDTPLIETQLLAPSSPPLNSEPSLVPTASSIPTESESALPTEEILLWTPHYNVATEAIDGALRADICLFTGELTDEELLSFLPNQKPEWFSPEGYGVFYGNGTLRCIQLFGATSIPENPITISIGAEEPFYCYVLPNEPRTSYCNGVEYTLTQYTAPDGSVTLFGETKLNDCYYTFSLQGTQETLAQNEADFALILQAFAGSNISLEDLSAIHPREIPVIFDKSLSHYEALNLDPYGSCFLPEVPSGFTEESIRHYQDPYNAYLSGLWTRGYDELSWRVSMLAEEDKQRLTHAEGTERYDLSLYPIPRADSVPEELREVVDNPIFYAEELSPELIWARAYKSGEQGDSDGWRMSFSVLYGDTVVTIRSKGVDPDWLYIQLLSIHKES